MHAMTTEGIDLIQKVVDNEPQMSAKERSDVLEKEDGRTPENNIRKSRVEQIDRLLKAVWSDEPVKNREEDTREAPVNKFTKGSSASPHRVGRGMDDRSDGLSGMNKVYSTTTLAVDITGAQKNIRLRRRHRPNGSEEGIAAGKGRNN